ncbi:MAG TPA: thioredoxin domain-containing protein, partial [Brevibacterium epidermidis]|nr:thioredoxin domain-containing protein [Brevibacterium epidermidis]
MAKHAAPRPRYRWWIPATVGAIAVALVLMILVIDRSGGDESTPTAEGTGPESEVVVTEVADPEQSESGDVASSDESDPMSDGPTDAPVTLVVFSDYQCPFCAAWSQDTLPKMLDYVDDGDLRIEWREVNVFGSASEQAAKAAYAAALQDKHWEFHDALFADGKPRSPDELTPEALTEVAEQIGLDTDQFTTDMNSSETAEAVADNAA